MSSSLGSLKRQRWHTEGWRKSEYSGRLILHSPNIINLCIDFYDGERQCGRLYHQYRSEAISFTSLFEAFDQMDKFYDDLQFPQAATKIRSFQVDRGKQRQMMPGERMPDMPEHRRKDMKEMESFDKVTQHKGKDATFLIRVQYRQNSSWQGEVTWVDEQKKEHFRSALELVRLIDSAMEETDK